MSINSIVTVHMDAHSPQLEQARFDVPLLLGHHSYFTELARTYRDTDGLKSDGFKEEDALYKMAQQLLMQQPKVSEFIIGKRKSATSDISDDLNAIRAKSDFYGLLLDSDERKTILDASSWAEINKVLLVVDLNDAQCLESKKDDEEILPLPEMLASLNRSQTIVTYHPKKEAYFAAAFMGRMLAEEVGVGSWANRIINNVPGYKLSQNEQSNLRNKNINYLMNVKNISITQVGRVISGIFIDVVRASNWLPVKIQERLVDLFIRYPKIPIDNQGLAQFYYTLKTLADEAVAMGVLADTPAPEIFVPNAAQVLDDDRKKRHLTKISIKGRYEGAVHSLEIHCHITQ